MIELVFRTLDENSSAFLNLKKNKRKMQKPFKAYRKGKKKERICLLFKGIYFYNVKIMLKKSNQNFVR